jgi:phosphopantothenoylcysteine decarboxylase/phosphopantothenate--cysteine ligase
MHPSEEIYEEKSSKLEGKRIVLGMTGSIAVTECFYAVRELIRHGAEVFPVMTEAAAKLAAPDSMEFASGRPPVLSLTGRTEHVDLMGSADLLLIYPATANTVSKIANGIDDTPVTSMAAVALGSGAPVAVVPAMHESMYRNPAVSSNVERLRSWGVRFIGPRTDGVRAKAASRDEVVENVIRILSKGPLSGRRVLVVGGRSEEPIDSMRVITNRSSGRTALALALRAFEMGADVELWMGGADVQVPDWLPSRRFSSVEDLLSMVPSASCDLAVVPAALADFKPDRVIEGKASSDSGLDLRLVPVEKVLPSLCRRCPRVIGFKAESGLDEAQLAAKARSRLERYGLAAAVADDVSVAGKSCSKVYFITADSCEPISGTKDEVADGILERAARLL